MEAVILAAGEGRRLRPLTTYYPKPMMPVGNRPILERIIQSLLVNEIRKITIVVGYQRDKLMRYFGDGRDFGVEIEYVIQEKQLGTAHALNQVAPKDDFILLPGDNVVDPKCIRKVKSEKNAILTAISGNPSKYGVVEIEKGRVKIIEKKRIEGRAQVFTGIGHFDAEIFKRVKEGMKEETYELPDIIGEIEGIKAISSECAWLDAVYPWDLLNLSWHSLKSMTRRLEGKIERATIIGNVEISEGTRIGAGSYIKGPVSIGKNCTIGPNSVIMPGVSIGDGSEIGALSYLENSIIMKNVYIGEGSRVRNAVLGNGASIGANSVLLSGKIKKIVDGEIVEMEDGGVIIGDGAEIGAGVVIAGGTLIGADSRIVDLRRIDKDIPNDARVM